jgi:hypothetical protein
MPRSNPLKKTIFMTTWIVLIGIVVISCQGIQNSTPAPSNQVILTIVSADKTITLNYTEFKAVGMASGYGGIKTTTDRISGPNQYGGVQLVDLIKLVHQSAEPVSVQVEGEDGYGITFSSNQLITGNFITYDPPSGEQIKIDGLKVILASEEDGQPLNKEKDGILRVQIISEKPNQVTDGHWSVKYINKMIIKPLLQDWVVNLEGAVSENMDRATFESGTAEKCHQANWIDDQANEWLGIPLWLLVGKVDDQNTHGSGAFNDALAKSGYTLEVISKNGKSVTFSSQEIARNDKILVVYSQNGNPLTDKDFPLRLVGDGVLQGSDIGQIEKIILHFPK